MCVLWILETALGCGLQYAEKEVQMCLDAQVATNIMPESSNGSGTVIETEDTDFYTIICHIFKEDYNILDYTHSRWGVMAASHCYS